MFGLCLSTLTGWVNRFAHAGDTALEVAETTAMRVGSFSRLVSMEPKWNHYYCFFFNL